MELLAAPLHLLLDCVQTSCCAGVAVMGPKGKYVVAAFAIFEFFGGSCLTLMVLWRQVITILPSTGVLPQLPQAHAQQSPTNH